MPDDDHPLLRPRPMTPEQIADLVERTRQAQHHLAEQRSARLERVARPELQRKRHTHPVRQSMADKMARYAFEHNVTCLEAAERHGQSQSIAYRGWRVLFPDLPLPGETARHRQKKTL